MSEFDSPGNVLLVGAGRGKQNGRGGATDKNSFGGNAGAENRRKPERIQQPSNPR